MNPENTSDRPEEAAGAAVTTRPRRRRVTRRRLLIVGGDPLGDLTALRDVNAVLREGRLVVDAQT